MAVAVNTQWPIRGVAAVTERPDGTRVVFRPHPTPIFDKYGKFAGAVNLLEDVTDEARGEDFHAQPRRCRRLANAVADDFAADTLTRMADEYEAKAAELLGHKRLASSGVDGNGIRQPAAQAPGFDGPNAVGGPRF
jgi:hypothetical protein